MKLVPTTLVLILLLIAAGSSRAAVIRVTGGAWHSDSHVRASNYWLETGAQLTGTGTVHGASRIQGLVSPGRGSADIGTRGFDGALAFDGGRFVCQLEGPLAGDKLAAAGGQVSGTASVLVTRAASVQPYRNIVIEGAPSSEYGEVTVAPSNGLSWGQSGTLDFWITAMADQTIDFPPIPDQVANTILGLSATASSGLDVVFAVESGPATLADGTNLTFSGAGTVVVVASQPGDSYWNEAGKVTNVFDVTKVAAQVFLLSLEQYYNGAAKTIAATTLPAGLTVEFTYNGSATPPTDAGTYAVTGLIHDAYYQGSASGIFQVFNAPASLGDTIWLDENGNGIKETGEAGVPNLRVWLENGHGTVLDTTTTDLAGRYLFAGLSPGTYLVRVDSSTLPAGLVESTASRSASRGHHQATVTLRSGESVRTANFGYNGTPPSSSFGALGDRVWVDANADGIQDPGEPGLAGVQLQLFSDGGGNGSFTTRLVQTWTDAAGFYIFTNLPVGDYVIRVATQTLPTGWTQTGDPDFFAETLPAGQGDHGTTLPLILAPGDVFVNADFGYAFPSRSRLGSQIYLDANADGVYNPAGGDYGIEGVTVSLLSNTGGVFASTTTDSAGNYLFTGLPAGTYTVWVNDAANIVSRLAQTGDPDGGFDSRSQATLDGQNDNLLQNHGYAPGGHGATLGLIGDTLFLDRDGNGRPGAGEGLQGVTVYLYDGSGMGLLKTAFTDPNGHYYFGGLPAMSYVVSVDTNTLPNGGVGLRHSTDPDTAGTGDNRSLVVLDPAELNLQQDFGYVSEPAGTIRGTVWQDSNADGILDLDELLRWPGIQIVLRNAAGNIQGSTYTDANGLYRFPQLAAGTYSVEVNDVSNRLHGLWQSVGPTPGAGGQSQQQPYSITLDAGQTNATGNIGYYSTSSELGDYVWYDINGNGLQEGGEPGLVGVQVTLRIEYPGGSRIELKTMTDARGRYLFSNLLLCERYRMSTLGDPTAEGFPRFQLSVVSSQQILKVDRYVETMVNAGSGTNDSREHAGVYALLTKSSHSSTYDFGYSGGPLLAVIGHVKAFTRDGQAVVRWEVLNSWETAGFWLERRVGGDWVRISPALIPYPLFEPTPVVFEEVDPGVAAGQTHSYRLIELESSGREWIYGPYDLTVDGPDPLPPAWDAGCRDLGAGWRRLDWFGDYALMGVEGWIWHNKHGFFYVASDSTAQGIWLFAPDMGWLWTANTLYPFIYREEDNAWLWFNGSSEPRWFFNLTSNRWENRP